MGFPFLNAETKKGLRYFSALLKLYISHQLISTQQPSELPPRSANSKVLDIVCKYFCGGQSTTDYVHVWKILSIVSPPTNTSMSVALGSKCSPNIVIVVPPLQLPTLGLTPVMSTKITLYLQAVWNYSNLVVIHSRVHINLMQCIVTNILLHSPSVTYQHVFDKGTASYWHQEKNPPFQ